MGPYRAGLGQTMSILEAQKWQGTQALASNYDYFNKQQWHLPPAASPLPRASQMRQQGMFKGWRCLKDGGQQIRQPVKTELGAASLEKCQR